MLGLNLCLPSSLTYRSYLLPIISNNKAKILHEINSFKPNIKKKPSMHFFILVVYCKHQNSIKLFGLTFLLFKIQPMLLLLNLSNCYLLEENNSAKKFLINLKSKHIRAICLIVVLEFLLLILGRYVLTWCIFNKLEEEIKCKKEMQPSTVLNKQHYQLEYYGQFLCYLIFHPKRGY